MRNRQLQEYFNSIKVRLERGTNKVLVSDTGFQFHKGTIRTFIYFFINVITNISIP